MQAEILHNHNRMKMKKLKMIFLLTCFTIISGAVLGQKNKSKHTFEIKEGQFWMDGKATQIHSGEMHFARIPEAYWRQRLKMAKAMGLNTIATYVFWNFHEIKPGVWDWTSERHNLAKFVKIAQEEGLWVILRPGPYVCAEWEFGGYPWFLQKVPGMQIRLDNAPFLKANHAYIQQLYAQVKDLLVTKGGPIIMVQAENEFGSFVTQRKDISLESHKTYAAKILKDLKEVGFNVPFFTSDGSWLFEGGVLEGALPTANGESNIANLKKVVNEYNHGKGPYMVAEFYPGWLDHWAEPFPKIAAERIVSQTQKYLDSGVSFNYYMVHGGTNFGFTSGANYNNQHDIQPDLTSYDYDAPISEAGWATPKYKAIRALLTKNQKNVPPIPDSIPVINLPTIHFSDMVDVLDMAEYQTPIQADTPMTFESLNQGHGYVLYSRRFNQPISGKLSIPGLRDYATIYVNGEKVGELNRYFKKYEMQIEVPFNATLQILVENMGRINFGSEIANNLKGIMGNVTIENQVITGDWNMYLLPFDSQPDVKKLNITHTATADRPMLFSATFNLSEVGDTFLDMADWGKGIIFVNGHNIGRFWSVGPQQTIYLPGAWLKKGENQIVVFDQRNHQVPLEIKSTKIPVLEHIEMKKEQQFYKD